MNVTSALIYDIRFVTEVGEEEGGLRITFQDGSAAFLEASHPHFQVLRISAVVNQGTPTAVGVVLDAAGRIVDLNTAHDTAVHSIQHSPDSHGRLRVGFWAFCAFCYLTLDHPEFERIRSTLAKAAGTLTRVWFANHSEVEVRDPTGEEEGETWWKIMDVRPI